MYTIGEFSILAKTTVKTLRYYEKEGLFCPSFIDQNGYRYYQSDKLLELSKIMALRQVGFSIEQIKQIQKGKSLDEMLVQKQKELESFQIENNFRLSKIQYLLGEKEMKYEVVVKDLPDYVVYFKEGVIQNYGELSQFILDSAQECLKTNPSIKCIEPDYCFVEYLDKKFKEHDIKVRYSQAVTALGVPNQTIKFKKLAPQKAVCIYHKGCYENLSEAYGYIMKYIEENNLKIVDYPRERYIDGVWNKQNVDEWLTEIQVPISM